LRAKTKKKRIELVEQSLQKNKDEEHLLETWYEIINSHLPTNYKIKSTKSLIKQFNKFQNYKMVKLKVQLGKGMSRTTQTLYKLTTRTK